MRGYQIHALFNLWIRIKYCYYALQRQTDTRIAFLLHFDPAVLLTSNTVHACTQNTHTHSLSLSLQDQFLITTDQFLIKIVIFFFFSYRAEFEDIYYGTIKKCWCFVDWKKLMVVIGLHTYLQVYIGRVGHSVVSLWDPMEPTRLLRSWDFSGHMQINP